MYFDQAPVCWMKLATPAGFTFVGMLEKFNNCIKNQVNIVAAKKSVYLVKVLTILTYAHHC
jgi:hypothetical protein